MAVTVLCHRMSSSRGVLGPAVEAAALDGLLWVEDLATDEQVTTNAAPDTGDIQITVVNQDASNPAYVVDAGPGSDYDVTQNPRWPIPPGGSVTFTVRPGAKVAFSST